MAKTKLHPVPQECKKCLLFWKYGIPAGGHNQWCCRYGKPAYKAVSHCRLEKSKHD